MGRGLRLPPTLSGAQLTYIVTQPAQDREAKLKELAAQIDEEHASPSRSAQDQAGAEEIDFAAKAMIADPKHVMDTIKFAAENKLISGYDDIARINREEAAMRDEMMQGKPTNTWGQNGMVEARGHMSVHLMLERHPEFGPKWWKDDKKFEKFLQQFPDARTYNRRGR